MIAWLDLSYLINLALGFFEIIKPIKLSFTMRKNDKKRYF